ncbi:hypothetical protein FHS43_006208 [Streptosporangium becharense]|uniref:Uncharacterized protein n=1 Tax=Streptosporangium becharense TaxID=1816182 RepID=A0A7W9IGK8_9ACTN|nr:hypothetical protein [Streptosporangium becharense]MBB2914896.1 hypothetical protein [Streptosporangium becharense]MBB5820293.1 hypothetical protein [Streptosporangium becharense]
MIGHIHHGVAALTIVTKQADSSVVSRRWLICEHCAESLAAHFGPPSDEVLATADARRALQEAADATPGYIHTDLRDEP